MHPYATDSPERHIIIFGIAVISILLAYTLHIAIERFGLRVPWCAETPSVMGLFAMLYKLFDKRLWRIYPLRRLGIVRVPDLNGEWDVEGMTSFEDSGRFEATARIYQTWTMMNVLLETKNSRSHSLSASVLTEQPYGTTLSYEYWNEPKPHAPPTMHSHRGTAVLRIKNTYELEGEYYSGRDRQMYGSLVFRKKD